MTDPTYIRAEINANPEWRLAFRLSEVDNDHAPIGWSRYIPLAIWLLHTFELKERATPQKPTPTGPLDPCEGHPIYPTVKSR